MPKIVATVEDWLDLGLRRFAQGGVASLKVQAMARELNCAKSSFYWYFGNRAEFVRRLIARWSELGTVAVIERVGGIGSPRQRLVALLHEAYGSRMEQDLMFHLRTLAASDDEVRALVQATERRRIHYLSQLLREAGVPADQAALKGEVMYLHYLGWYERNKHRPVEVQELDEVVQQLTVALGLPDEGSTDRRPGP